MSKDRHTLLCGILDRIRQVTRRDPKRTGDQWQCCCPAHEDDTASLSVMAGKSAIVLTCFAGCSFQSVVQALRVAGKDLFYESSGGRRGGLLRKHGWNDEILRPALTERGSE